MPRSNVEEGVKKKKKKKVKLTKEKKTLEQQGNTEAKSLRICKSVE